jgi:hypothetical protein
MTESSRIPREQTAEDIGWAPVVPARARTLRIPGEALDADGGCVTQ